jgi:hypothetical protein
MGTIAPLIDVADLSKRDGDTLAVDDALPTTSEASLFSIARPPAS